MKITFSSLCVQIVGDGQYVRARLRMLSLELGIRKVTWVTNAEAALNALMDVDATFPDLIITETNEILGAEIDFCQSVRANPKMRNTNLPILIFADPKKADALHKSEQICGVSFVSQRINREALRKRLVECLEDRTPDN